MNHPLTSPLKTTFSVKPPWSWKWFLNLPQCIIHGRSCCHWSAGVPWPIYRLTHESINCEQQKTKAHLQAASRAHESIHNIIHTYTHTHTLSSTAIFIGTLHWCPLIPYSQTLTPKPNLIGTYLTWNPTPDPPTAYPPIWGLKSSP